MRALLHPGDLTPDLIERWRGFCHADPLYYSPFYAPEFTQAVAHVRDDVRIAVFERAGDVIGFLPFHLTRSGTAKPIGGQLNDYQGPITAPHTRLTPGELLNGAQVSSYDYNHLPTSFTALAQDAHSLSASPQMDLSQGYEAFVGRKDSKWTKAKREIRRRYRKTEKDIGPIRFTFHDPSDAIFAQHIEMKNALLQRVGSHLQIGDDWLGQVLDVLRHSEGPGFASVMTTLHAGDKLIAAHFGIRTADVWHWWFPSYDLAAYKLGPGINLVDQCAQAAQDHGIDTIDFGRGDGAFKLLFADRQVELCEGAVARPGSLAKFVRQGTQSLVSAAERLPLGRYSSYPRRAAAKFVTGVALPGMGAKETESRAL